MIRPALHDPDVVFSDSFPSDLCTIGESLLPLSMEERFGRDCLASSIVVRHSAR